MKERSYSRLQQVVVPTSKALTAVDDTLEGQRKDPALKPQSLVTAQLILQEIIYNLAACVLEIPPFCGHRISNIAIIEIAWPDWRNGSALDF